MTTGPTELTQQEKRDAAALCPWWREMLLNVHAHLMRIEAVLSWPKNWVLNQLNNTAYFQVYERSLDSQNEIL